MRYGFKSLAVDNLSVAILAWHALLGASTKIDERLTLLTDGVVYLTQRGQNYYLEIQLLVSPVSLVGITTIYRQDKKHD